MRVGHRAAVIVPPAPTIHAHPLSPDPLDSSVLSHETLDDTVDERDVRTLDRTTIEHDDVTFARQGSNQPRASPISRVLFGSPSAPVSDHPLEGPTSRPRRRPSRTSGRGSSPCFGPWARPFWTGTPRARRALACWTVAVENVRGASVRTGIRRHRRRLSRSACLGAGRPSFALVDEETRGALFSLFAARTSSAGSPPPRRVWR